MAERQRSHSADLCRRRRVEATTLIEVLIASSILLLIISFIFFVYVNGTRAWHRGQNQADLLQDLMLVQEAVRRDLASSAYASLTIDQPNRAFSVLSPRGPNGRPVVVDGEIEWQSYVVFYHDATQRAVLRLEVPLIAAAPERSAPAPIEQYDPGSGPRNLVDYLGDGEVIGRDIYSLTVTPLAGARVLKVELEGRRPRHQDTEPEKITLPAAVQFRN